MKHMTRKVKRLPMMRNKGFLFFFLYFRDGSKKKKNFLKKSIQSQSGLSYLQITLLCIYYSLYLCKKGLNIKKEKS